MATFGPDPAPMENGFLAKTPDWRSLPFPLNFYFVANEGRARSSNIRMNVLQHLTVKKKKKTQLFFSFFFLSLYSLWINGLAVMVLVLWTALMNADTWLWYHPLFIAIARPGASLPPPIIVLARSTRLPGAMMDG